MKEELERGKRHIRFCVELYKMQVEAKRHFVHEHPARSKAWNMPELMNLKEMIELTMNPAVGMIELDMCAFGMTSQDEAGEGLVKKTTRILSTSEEVLRRLSKRCENSGRSDEEKHRHVHLIQGRAQRVQIYPRRFAEEICQGIAAQKKCDSLGMRSRPLMSIEEMEEVMKSRGDTGCPSRALHEEDANDMIAYDDLTGQELDPVRMIKARLEEIAYVRDMGGHTRK